MTKLERIRQIIFALCLLAPWTLLWLDSTLVFPYETGKAWLFRILVEVAFGLLLIYYLVNLRSVKQVPSGVPVSLRIWRYSLLAFLFWSALADVFGIDAYRSLVSNYERMSGYLAYLHWAMYFLCLVEVLNTGRARWLTLNLLVIIMLVASFGLLDTEKRIISTLGNPIYLGNLAALGIMLCGFVFAQFRSGTRKHQLMQGMLVLSIVTLLLLVLFKTASRGPMIALLIGAGAVLFWLFLARLRQSPKRFAIIAVAGSLLVTAGLSLGSLQNITKMLRDSDYYALQRIGKISMSNQTTADRLQNWSIAFDAATRHPIKGWGQENYAIAFNEHYQAGVMDKAKIWFDRTHNAYLDVLLAAGWVGLALYFLCLYMPFHLVVLNSGWSTLQKAFSLGLLMTFMVKNIVGFDTFSSTLIWISFAALIWQAVNPTPARQERKQPQTRSRKRSRKSVQTHSASGLELKQILPIVAVIVVTVSAVTMFNVRPYLQNQLFMHAALNDPAAVKKILELDSAALRYGQNAKLAILDMILRENRGKPLNRTQKQQQISVYRRANTLVSQELERQPRNARIRYNGALIMASSGAIEEAIKMFEVLLKDSPNRSVFWGTLSKLYASSGQTDAAKSADARQKSLNPRL